MRYWKRAIQIAVDLGVNVMNSEFNGRPEAPSVSEAQFWRSLEELLPVFEREGIRLVLDRIRTPGGVGPLQPTGSDVPVSAPHTFHQGGDIEGITSSRAAADALISRTRSTTAPRPACATS